MFEPLLTSILPAHHRRREWLYLWAGHLFLAVLFLALLLTDASAQEAGVAAPDRFILTVLLEAFAPYIVALAGGVAAFLTPKVFALLGMVIDEKRASALNDGFERGATLTLERMGDQLRGGIPAQRREAAVSAVVKYAEQNYPGAVKHFGKTPQQLRQMAEIRLSGLLVGPNAEQRVSAPVDQSDAR